MLIVLLASYTEDDEITDTTQSSQDESTAMEADEVPMSDQNRSEETMDISQTNEDSEISITQPTTSSAPFRGPNT